MAQRTVFLDTSFVIALENKDDPHHARAKALDGEMLKEDAVLLFHWGFLFEISDGFARLARRARGLQLLARFTSEAGYQCVPITEPLLQEALDLYRSSFADRQGMEFDRLPILCADDTRRTDRSTECRPSFPPGRVQGAAFGRLVTVFPPSSDGAVGD